MSLFRSERMGYYTVTMPRENSWDILNELGYISSIQFIDQDPLEAAYHRPYASQLKRCDEIENKLYGIESELIRFEKKILPCDDVKKYLESARQFLNARDKPQQTYFDEIEDYVNEQEKKLTQNIKIYEEFQTKKQYYHFNKIVLNEAYNVIKASQIGSSIITDEDIEAQQQTAYLKGTQLHYSTGIINTEDIIRFKKIVFRVTRGNNWTSIVHLKSSDLWEYLKNAKEGSEVSNKLTKGKSVYIVIYQGGEQDIFRQKIDKICESFGALTYKIPASETAFQKELAEINTKLADLENMIILTKQSISKQLEAFTEISYDCSYIEQLKIHVCKEKLIYQNMNYLVNYDQVQYGYAWISKESEDKVRKLFSDLRWSKNMKVDLTENQRPPKSVPPTYFKTNDFTFPFQQVVETYGVATYREVNPGLFAIIMFPFKFGIMFGDIGHGSLILIIGILLCCKQEKVKQLGMGDILMARYLFLFMGIFSVYCGFIYNDFLATPWNLFGSCYEKAGHEAIRKKDCVYPFGLDPKWYIAENELSMFNSLKMKLAVIVGVIQMTFGIILKSFNAIHFGRPLDFLFEFIPQLVFMLCTFFYMIAMIFIKWSINWQERTQIVDGKEIPGTSIAPGIINSLIKHFLGMGSAGEFPLYDRTYQENIQFWFLIIALICVPLMLLPKPLFELVYHRFTEKAKPKPMPVPSLEQIDIQLEETHQLNEVLINKDKEMEIQEKEKEKEKKKKMKVDPHQEEEFEFSEHMVHQLIETIEYVLGTVSNTASYLRLWALSLAHSQLAKVFFEKTIGGGIESGSFLIVFIGYFFFVNITLAVIMGMDTMECFLHAIRLQWVEFQNKFYKAEGYRFTPISFGDIQLKKQ